MAKERRISSETSPYTTLPGVKMFVRNGKLVTEGRLMETTSVQRPELFNAAKFVSPEPYYPAAMQQIDVNGISVYVSIAKPKRTIEDVLRDLAAAGGNKFAIVQERNGNAEVVDILEVSKPTTTFADHLAGWLALANPQIAEVDDVRLTNMNIEIDTTLMGGGVTK